MYPLLIIIVAALAIVRGYRRGLTGQVTSVLGMAFGIICAHIFIPMLDNPITALISNQHIVTGGEYLITNLAGGIVFFITYFLFRTITGIIRMALKALGTSLLDSILGAVFCMVNYMLMLSICLNVAIGWNPESVLMHDARADDGNVVSLTVTIAPACLGSESFADFAHTCQLRDAKKISANFMSGLNVETITQEYGT